MSRLKFDMHSVISAGVQTMLGANPILDGRRIDANETMTFSRELEHIFKEIYETDFPALAGRQLVPIRGDVESGAESATHTEVTGYGEMKKVVNWAKDFPGVEEKGTQTSLPIYSWGESYQYTIQDLRRSAMIGRSLDARKAALARNIAERTLDQLLCTGDGGSLKGIANLTGVPAPIAKTTYGAGSNWTNGATPAEILKDCRNLVQAPSSATLNTHEADTLALDTLSYNYIRYTNLNQGQTAQILSGGTILDYLLANVDGLKSIVPWARLNTAGASNVSRAIAFERSPNVLWGVLPQDFEQFPPQVQGLAFVVPCHFRFGGVRAIKPLAIAYMDGTGNA